MKHQDYRKPCCFIILLLSFVEILNAQVGNTLKMSDDKWENKMVHVTILDTEGNTIKGQLLSLHDSSIFIYVSDSNYAISKQDNLITYIPAKEIDRILINKNSLAKKGAKIGAISSVAAPIYVIILFAAEGNLGYAVLAAPSVWLMTIVTNTITGGFIGHLSYLNADYKFSEQEGTFLDFKDEFQKYALLDTLSEEHNFKNYKGFD
jgi:hypothetical protein